MSLKKRQQVISIKHQSGQTMVFALVFIVVILIGVIILFNTGQLTRHKMEVQNAADAAAYSAAILSARELNFMAYTNRAMVANQVSIGQFTAFNSWSQKFVMAANRQTLGYPMMSAFNILGLGFIPVGDIIATIIQAVSSGYNSIVYQPVGRMMNAIGKVAIQALPKLQKLYYRHQLIMTVATQVSQAEMLPAIIEANAKDAKLSNFGALAVFLSAVQQQITHMRDDDNFLKVADVDSDEGQQATRRFAAFVNDSRDDWTRDRDRTDLRPSFPIGGGPLRLTFDLGFDVLGGTELRFVESGGEELYDWTSLDTVGFGLGVRVEINFCIIPNPTGGCLWKIEVDKAIVANLPFGGASHELHSGAQLGPVISNWGALGDEIYGRTLSRTYPSAVEATLRGRQPSSTFDGLPKYIDINPENYPGVNEAPVYIVSVRKNAIDLNTSDRINEKGDQLTSGNFDVQTKLSGGRGTGELDLSGPLANELKSYITDIVDGYQDELLAESGGFGSGFADAAANEFEGLLDDILGKMSDKLNSLLIPDDADVQDGAIFAIAAARVYFKNPDAPDEMGSTFTPYWQVRLEPVDDDIRRWSAISQGLTKLTSADSLEQDSHLDNLSKMAN